LIDKTDFFRALRPFSFVVALSSCLLGVVLALQDGATTPYLGGLLVASGLLLQAAVNLINDYSDRDNPNYDASQRLKIVRNMRIGRGLLLLVVVAGLYMVSIRGLPLLLLGLVGILGAWGYTCGTINYKQRGLGVVLVFFLMGGMMVGGCYFTMTGHYTWRVFWLSLPFSLFTALLLLANELRDYEEDREHGIGTLSVRIGFIAATRLYGTMLLFIYGTSLLLYWQGLLSTPLLLLLTLIMVLPPLRQLRRDAAGRRLLPQVTGRLYLSYSAAYLITLWLEPALLL
jgi:1,4-dihydroxy-2-naphthoate octaprenyltransferase